MKQSRLVMHGIARPLLRGEQRIGKLAQRMEHGEKLHIRPPLTARIRGRKAKMKWHENLDIHLQRFQKALAENRGKYIAGQLSVKRGASVGTSLAIAVGSGGGFTIALSTVFPVLSGIGVAVGSAIADSAAGEWWLFHLQPLQEWQQPCIAESKINRLSLSKKKSPKYCASEDCLSYQKNKAINP